MEYQEDQILVKADKVSPLDVVKTIIETEGHEDPGPFMVCDLGHIVCKHQEWMDAMPDILPHYAVKCNDSRPILKTLACLGAGFDCASSAEMEKILFLGVEPDRIIFANTVKLPSHIRYAYKHGIRKMTFDNQIELLKISRYHPAAQLVLRIRCDDPDAEVPFGSKFGCDPVTEAYDLLKMAKDMNLTVVGVSFHVGSGCINFGVYETAIEYTKEVFIHAKTLGHDVYLVDIGGGFPGEKGTNISKCATVINRAIKKHFSESHIKVIAEPGRYYVSSATLLACMVYAKKKTTVLDPETNIAKPHNMYYINDGLHGSFSIFEMHKIERIPVTLNDPNKEETFCSSSVFGPTCDAKDQLFDDILLPELNIFEWMVFEEMGGYTLRAPRNFNGFSGPKYYFVANKSVYNLLKDKNYLHRNNFVFHDSKRQKISQKLFS